MLVADKFTVDNIIVEMLEADRFTVDKFTLEILVTLAYDPVIFVKITLVPDKFPIEQFDMYTKFELLPI